jgi:hypothetical protein
MRVTIANRRRILLYRVCGNARVHVAEPSEWLDFAALAGTDKGAQHRRRLAALVAAEERPAAALRPNRHAVHETLTLIQLLRGDAVSLTHGFHGEVERVTACLGVLR